MRSGAYRTSLRRVGLRQSMSDRTNPYHNAWTESFIGTLKVEKLQGARFIDAVGARTELSASIDSYYNTHRQHSSLSCKLPSKFEADLPFKN